jgi:hypothetical protein
MIHTVFTAVCLIALAPPPGLISLEPLSKNEEISGCGFSCSLVGIRGVENAQIFGSDKTVDKSNKIYGFIRVNGRLQKLKLGVRKEFPKRKNQVHVGDKFIETWSNEAVQIRFECTITGTNDEGDDFEGKMIVRNGKSSQVFQIDGGEGC